MKNLVHWYLKKIKFVLKNFENFLVQIFIKSHQFHEISKFWNYNSHFEICNISSKLAFMIKKIETFLPLQWKNFFKNLLAFLTRNTDFCFHFYFRIPNSSKIYVSSHIAQNIAETCQKYFQSFIATEIFSQHFFQILQNISSQHYNFNFLKYFWKQINI